MLILGVLALVFPFYFTALAKVVVGWFFLLIGAVTLYNAIWARKLADGLLSGAVAALYLAVGVYLSFVASGGLVGLTAIVAVAFLIDGAIEYALAMRRKPRAGWNWIALSGLSSAMLGGVLLALLPTDAAWALGAVLGLNSVTTGLSVLAMARAVRRPAE
ncbi:HdeD family acid-resistance protein [Marivivens donghaensis]|uniref:HdeD family acid-resistance protein n=2 Tax=Marivivens donghaensis TaxID=1699413 RepID=A0ABX0VTK7_9RHOB|nr:HdeD family acid-resistance protein [Marivivens donghaensis]